MGTRAQIFVRNKNQEKGLAIYHHFDGYVKSGLGDFLRYYIKTPKDLSEWIEFILNQSWNENNSPNYSDYLEVQDHHLEPKVLKMNQFLNLTDNVEQFYSSYSKPTHADLEFIYFINFDEKTVEIRYLDLYKSKLVDWRDDTKEDDAFYFDLNIDELFEKSKILKSLKQKNC